MVEFVAGTGGKNLYHLGDPQARLGATTRRAPRACCFLALQPGYVQLVLPRHQRRGAGLRQPPVPLSLSGSAVRPATPAHGAR